jgi:hypothetical protein
VLLAGVGGLVVVAVLVCGGIILPSWSFLFLIIQTIVAIWLFIANYKNGQVVSNKWLWWIIIPFSLSIINMLSWKMQIYGLDWMIEVPLILLPTLFCLAQFVVFIVYVVERKKQKSVEGFAELDKIKEIETTAENTIERT